MFWRAHMSTKAWHNFGKYLQPSHVVPFLINYSPPSLFSPFVKALNHTLTENWFSPISFHGVFYVILVSCNRFMYSYYVVGQFIDWPFQNKTIGLCSHVTTQWQFCHAPVSELLLAHSIHCLRWVSSVVGKVQILFYSSKSINTTI